jgi:hypothetical protein
VTPRSIVERLRGGDIGGGEDCQREREQHAEHSAENGEVNRFEHWPQIRHELIEGRRHGARNDIGHTVSAGHQILRTSLYDDPRLDEQREDDDDDSGRPESSHSG